MNKIFFDNELVTFVYAVANLENDPDGFVDLYDTNGVKVTGISTTGKFDKPVEHIIEELNNAGANTEEMMKVLSELEPAICQITPEEEKNIKMDVYHCGNIPFVLDVNFEMHEVV